MDIYIKSDAPIDGSSLCESCAWGFVARGYRETDVLVVCQVLYPERRMPFSVRVCTKYLAKNRPAMKQMEEIALVLDRSDLKRDAGFLPADRDAAGVQKTE